MQNTFILMNYMQKGAQQINEHREESFEDVTVSPLPPFKRGLEDIEKHTNVQ